ncbi:MAG: HAD family hydrolase [Nitrospirae bacterium]|nr:HAD family hydrolase [Nitrospirota bacterium]
MTSFSFSSIDTILFDLDGTLVDSFTPIRHSFNHMLRHFGQERELTERETLDLVGGPLDDSVARLLPAGLVSSGTSIFREHYEKVYLEMTYPMPGAPLLLSKIFQKGLSQGVITNKLGDSAREIIRHFGWSSLLPLCLGEGDGLPLKPNPDMILHAAQLLKKAPENMLFVGDSPFDLLAARKAGCRICLLTTGTHRREALITLGPDLLFDSLGDLGQWLRGPDRDP